MKKISEYKDDEAVELLADILEPVCTILADKEVQESMSKSKMDIIHACMKRHPKEIRQIMAVLNGVPFEDYHIGVGDIPVVMLEIINDKELVSFFLSQGQMALNGVSGSATENTEEEGPQENSSGI